MEIGPKAKVRARTLSAGPGRQSHQPDRRASQSIDVMTGADIRRFDEFTDATTRVVVGLHQDLSELREQVARHQRVLDDDRRTNLTPLIVVGGLPRLHSCWASLPY